MVGGEETDDDVDEEDGDPDDWPDEGDVEAGAARGGFWARMVTIRSRN